MYKHNLQPFAENYPIPEELPSLTINDPSLPLISIVTPSYNQGNFIRETIESVLQQDYPNIEYWVIDGGSTDKTISILKEYEHDHRFHWISESDKGQSDAINKGIARCRGEIFSWLCSDDMLVAGALQQVASAWLEAKQPALIYGFAKLIDQNGTDLGYCPGQSSKVTFKRLLQLKNFLMQPATFSPIDHVRSLGGVNSALHYAMDFDLWIKLTKTTPIKHIPKVIALYRLHTASKTMSSIDNFLRDLNGIFEELSTQGFCSKQRSKAILNLFAAKSNLSPEPKDLIPTLRYIKSAIKNDIKSTPESLFILFKLLSRLIIGRRLWSLARFARSRLG